MNRLQPLFNEEDRQAPRDLVEQALRLVGRIQRGSADAARAAETELQRWRQASPAHAEAVATAQRIWNATDAGALADRLPMPLSAEQQRRSRRRVTGMLGGLGVLALAGAGWRWQQPVHEVALRTDRAQTLAHTLPDGSVIDLAANTALQVTFHRGRRTVRLLKGEACFNVAHDAQRPFSVETPWGRVRVLGTVFTVSARDGRMRVAVAQGRVAVWPVADGHGSGAWSSMGDAPPAAILQAGETVEADVRGVGSRASLDVSEVADWKQGWLVFRNTRLPEALARWNDHLPPPMQLLGDDPALRDLRVTGSYPLSQPQAFIGSLPSILPVQVTRMTDGSVAIRVRR